MGSLDGPLLFFKIWFDIISRGLKALTLTPNQFKYISPQNEIISFIHLNTSRHLKHLTPSPLVLILVIEVDSLDIITTKALAHCLVHA